MHSSRRSFPVRSYWLSASNYYVLSVAVAMAAFVVMMGVLRDESEETAYVPAGIAASVVLMTAVVIRQAILKKHYVRMAAARRLDQNLSLLRSANPAPSSKLTIEQNATILRELKRKSEAATVLARYADGHREVFELCGQYLEINAREMLTVNAGSPRIAALRKGREIAEDYHRRHMLRWAEIETMTLFERAQGTPKNSEKLTFANEALAVIRTASAKYPTDRRLFDSATAITEFVTKTRVSDLLERAARAESRGNSNLAERHLRSALDEIENSKVHSADRELAANKIRSELDRLIDREMG
jgi:hypothetical protein